MIDTMKFYQYGLPRDKKDILGITIHNTNNYTMTARELFNYLNEESKDSNGCHYLVDDKEVIEVMPLDWMVYHTGKGMDYGNKYTIAIEICSNLNDEQYLVGQAKAIVLIKRLMKDYGFDESQIYFHKDFNPQTYCPASILNLYKTKKEFLKLLEEV